MEDLRKDSLGARKEIDAVSLGFPGRNGIGVYERRYYMSVVTKTSVYTTDAIAHSAGIFGVCHDGMKQFAVPI